MTEQEEEDLMREPSEREFSRRQFMIYEAAMAGAPILLAAEAVASTAMEHPEWDMDETMTWAEWENLR